GVPPLRRLPQAGRRPALPRSNPGRVTLRCGVFTDGLARLSLPDAAAWCVERNVVDLELGAGGYSPAPHLKLELLLNDSSARRKLLNALEERRCRLTALNASGNPLHPDPGIAIPHDTALRGALRLAALL